MKVRLGIAFYIALVFSLSSNSAELPDVIDGLRPSVVGIGVVRPARASKKSAC